LVEVLAVSIACLQVEERVAFDAGFDAAVLKPLRCASNACFIGPSTCGAALAIFVKQASYFLMYSSHSATPVFGSDESDDVFVESELVAVEFDVVEVVELAAVVLAAVVVVVFFAAVFVVAVLVVVLAAPPQPMNSMQTPRQSAAANKVFIFI
jgi:hypothetical protein